MSRFSLSFKFGLLLVGFILATGGLVTLFSVTGRRVGVEMNELKDRAFPEYEQLSGAQDSFKDFTAKIEEVVSTGERDLLESAQRSGRRLVGYLDAVLEISKTVSEFFPEFHRFGLAVIHGHVCFQMILRHYTSRLLKKSICERGVWSILSNLVSKRNFQSPGSNSNARRASAELGLISKTR